MESLTIRPILGLRTNVPQNSPYLFKEGGLCHCVDGVNFDLIRKRGASTKSFGYKAWSSSATAEATKCLGMFELIDSDGTSNHIYFDNGQMYVFDTATRGWDEIDHGTPFTMANTDMDLYSMVQYGDHIIWTDYGEHEPYCWQDGDATFEEAIASGTAYQFRYLEVFQNYVFGAYSDQTNGDIEIRWSNLLPVPGALAGDLTFAGANQLYKPGNDSITGIKRFGSNGCFLYGKESIDSIDYYANYLTPFAIRNMVAGQGATNHHSVVDTGGRHFLFNQNYGFCEYRGGIEFPYGGRPISEPIEDIIYSIDPTYYGFIQGIFLPHRNEVAWAVPLNGASSPTDVLYYNIMEGTWRKEDKTAWFIDNWSVSSTLIWSGATYDLADSGITYWSDFGSSSLSSYVSKNQRVVFGNTDGYLYYRGTETANSSPLSGYRVEPIIDFGRPEDRDLLLEIWFDIVERGTFNIFVEHRGGDTISECEAESFSNIGYINCNDPDNAVIYTNKNYRFHQIKWGTTGADEKFGVNTIEFKYVPQGRY